MAQADRILGPPFRFDGVTARVFPLRAHAHALQRLCDTYLNLDRDQVCFRPSAPYVLLVLLNYGEMSYASETAAHYGWVSQNEVYFGAPLDWRRRRNGRWETGSGVVAPFIFVDQAWSIEIGREVYGWPKMPAEFLRQVNTWASGSPAARENLLTLATETFLTPYASERPSSVPLVEIDRAAPLSIGPSLWQAPLSIDNPWWGPMTLAREAMRGWWPTGLSDAPMYVPLMLQSLRMLYGGPSPAFYTANLKQVRSLEDPTLAAYQAITMAPMQLTSLHRAGLLGESRILLGDPTGGYRIRVQRHPMFPIIETLGLVVSEEESHSDARDVAIRGYTAGATGNTRLERFPEGLTSSDDLEHGVATLAPLFPYWLEGDLMYGCGDTITWRDSQHGGTVWARRAPGRDAGRDAGSDAGSDARRAAVTPTTDDRDDRREEPPHSYDATWGARGIPAPPYYYPQLTMRFVPLKVTSERDLVDAIQALEPPEQIGELAPFMPGGTPFVIMMVVTSEEMGAEVNSAGWWWKRQVSFCVPVTWTPRHPWPASIRKPGPVALLSMATFVDSELAATTAREIGPEVIAANLYAPPDSWLDHDGPRADRRLLWLSTTVLPALDVGAEAKQRVLLELLAVNPAHIAPGARAAMPEVAPPNIPDDGMPICILARRRIRDATDPGTYAYQEWFSQHMLSRRLPDCPGWQLSPDPLELRLHQYPDPLDLVRYLTLHVSDSEYTKSQRPGRGWEGATVNVITTGFAWATLDVTQECNTSLAVCSHGTWWDPRTEAPPEPGPVAVSLAAAPQRSNPLEDLLAGLAGHVKTPR
ncbi:MAG TPA: hypothetical protein VF516_27215 [Kofleriaceae bacterium]